MRSDLTTPVQCIDVCTVPIIVDAPSSSLSFISLRNNVNAYVDICKRNYRNQIVQRSRTQSQHAVSTCRGLYSSIKYRSISFDFPTAESPSNIIFKSGSGRSSITGSALSSIVNYYTTRVIYNPAVDISGSETDSGRELQLVAHRRTMLDSTVRTLLLQMHRFSCYGR